MNIVWTDTAYVSLVLSQMKWGIYLTQYFHKKMVPYFLAPFCSSFKNKKNVF